jgi:hypothetical protein
VVLEKKKERKKAADLCQHWEEKKGKKIMPWSLCNPISHKKLNALFLCTR